MLCQQVVCMPGSPPSCVRESHRMRQMTAFFGGLSGAIGLRKAMAKTAVLRFSQLGVGCWEVASWTWDQSAFCFPVVRITVSREWKDQVSAPSSVPGPGVKSKQVPTLVPASASLTWQASPTPLAHPVAAFTSDRARHKQPGRHPGPTCTIRNFPSRPFDPWRSCGLCAYTGRWTWRE